MLWTLKIHNVRYYLFINIMVGWRYFWLPKTRILGHANRYSNNT